MERLNDIAASALRELAAAGADKAQCSATTIETREFNVDGGEFSLFRTLFDNNLSMAAFKDGKRGTLSVNRFEADAVAAAAVECLAVAGSGSPDPAWDIAPGPADKSFKDGVPEPDMDRFFMRCRELIDDVHARYPLILIEQMIASHKKVRAAYANSNGVSYGVLRGEYSLSLMFSAHEGELSSSFFGTGVTTASLDAPFITMGSVSQDLADVEKQVHSVPVTGKFTGTVLLPPACLAEFLSSVLDNFVSDRPILDGTSVWKTALGTKVADSRISLSMAPRDPRIVCGERFTGEGFESADYDVIRDGVLSSFMLSLYVANKTGYARAKNSSGNMVMAPGGTPLADIISGIKKGIIVGRFSGGAPSNNGDFSGVAKNSFLIEDGRITNAVSETMINGNLAELLKSLVSLSKETVADGSSVLPYAAFDGVVISGK